MQHSTGQYDDLARVPRARPREGCRRRTTASRHRRHSPPRCSCRMVPPIRDARLVDLNLAVFMCNSVARQERVCRAQRPAAKIDAIATSASGRDRTSAFEPAETPANCGLFLRDRETSVRIGLRGGAGRTQTSNQTVMSWKDSNLNQAVMSEPLRLRKRVIFPPTGRKDSKYLPGMQFCRTSLRRGQVRGAEGREPLDEPK